MPELPDLTVYSANLASKLNGKKIKSIESFLSDKRLNVSRGELQNAISGSSLSDVQRRGKEILFQFSNNNSLLLHLMLGGGFKITPTPDPVQFKAMTISFDDGPYLVVTDPKVMVTAKLNPPESKVPDALEIDVD